MALLTDFDTMKALLDLDGDEAGYPQLSFVMTSVDAAIQNHLKRELEEDSRTETRFLNGVSRMLPLSGLPVVSVESVVIDDEVVDPSRYKKAVYGLEFNYMPDGLTVVTYKGGVDEIHRDIKRAAELQVAYEYQNIDHVGAETVSNEGGSVSRPALGLLKEVIRMLNPHVHPMGAFL
jgi:hypothetical protein